MTKRHDCSAAGILFRGLARAALAAGIAAGLLPGLARVAQGAHFLSHVLWSGLVCWLVMLALHALLTGTTASTLHVAGEHR